MFHMTNLKKIELIFVNNKKNTVPCKQSFKKPMNEVHSNGDFRRNGEKKKVMIKILNQNKQFINKSFQIN